MNPSPSSRRPSGSTWTARRWSGCSTAWRGKAWWHDRRTPRTGAATLSGSPMPASGRSRRPRKQATKPNRGSSPTSLRRKPSSCASSWGASRTEHQELTDSVSKILGPVRPQAVEIGRVLTRQRRHPAGGSWSRRLIKAASAPSSRSRTGGADDQLQSSLRSVSTSRPP